MSDNGIYLIGGVREGERSVTAEVITPSGEVKRLRMAKKLWEKYAFSSADTVGRETYLEMKRDSEICEAVKKYSVYARVQPEHKTRIVNAWKANGYISAMTGDGVNDAPSIKAADIGIAMGITGTDVAKGAADIILTDDNFATIVTAVKEGRGIFDNIRKAVHFLISCNLGEIITVFIGMILFGASPFAAIQLLWINLVTDGAPALCLGMEPVDKDIMNRPPREKNENIFNKDLVIKSVIQGAMFALATLITYAIGNVYSKDIASTMAFVTMALGQVFYVLSVRSEKLIPMSNIKGNKYILLAIAFSIIMTFLVSATPLNTLFSLTNISLPLWACSLGFSLLPMLGSEIYKAVNQIKTKNDHTISE